MRHLPVLLCVVSPSAGTGRIPDNELQVAFDLYRALQSFYQEHPTFQKRPLVVLGEVSRDGAASVTIALLLVGPLCSASISWDTAGTI